MNNPKRRSDGDDTPVSGGARTPRAAIRDDLADILEGTDELSTHLLRLQKLHPSLKLSFRAENIEQLSAADMRQLLSDINEQLGIKGFNAT